MNKCEWCPHSSLEDDGKLECLFGCCVLDESDLLNRLCSMNQSEVLTQISNELSTIKDMFKDCTKQQSILPMDTGSLRRLYQSNLLEHMSRLGEPEVYYALFEEAEDSCHGGLLVNNTLYTRAEAISYRMTHADEVFPDESKEDETTLVFASETTNQQQGTGFFYFQPMKPKHLSNTSDL